MDEIAFAYRNVVMWNVVPWWVGDGDLLADGKAPSLMSEVAHAAPFLAESIDLLPRVGKVTFPSALRSLRQIRAGSREFRGNGSRRR